MAIILDECSFMTVPIEMYFGATHLSTGTAFNWKSDDGNYFLITNWHNVSGVDPQTRKSLSAHGGRPDTLHGYFVDKSNIGEKVHFSFRLKDAEGVPYWLVHPNLGNVIDAVALPLTLDPEPEWYAANKVADEPLAVDIGQDVFILGYPFGIGAGGAGGFPVWKRGSIASEPRLFLGGNYYFLVDTASRPGMSGSPVIRRSWGNHVFEGGGSAMTTGSATRLVGIYSGRLATADPLDAQLGLVWPTNLIAEIIAGGRRDPGIF